MIWDLFPFYNELEILKIRLTELDPVVGRFVIVESNVTHKGDPKPLYFADNRSQFDAWSDKIEHIAVDDMPMQKSFDAEPAHMFDDPAWKREWFQMDRAMQNLKIGDTEAVIYSDVDEIPSAAAVEDFTASDSCVTLRMPNFQFYLNWKLPDHKTESCMVIGRVLKANKRAQIRHSHGLARNRVIDNAGWHFSSMGGPEAVKQKLNSFCHWNRKCVLEYSKLPEPKADPIPLTWEGTPISKVPIDINYPKYVRKNIGMLAEKGFVHLPLLDARLVSRQEFDIAPRFGDVMTNSFKVRATGLELSRIIIGTGSNNGKVFETLGKDNFVKTLHHAFDRGIKAVDTSEAYAITVGWLKDALAGRDDVKLQMKIGRLFRWPDGNILPILDEMRRKTGRDFFDSILMHCMEPPDWDSRWRSHMDYLNELRGRKRCSAIGASCHNLPAMRRLHDHIWWLDILLARMNPFGVRVDDETGRDAPDGTDWLPGLIAMHEIKSANGGGCAILAMKILGDGTFASPNQRFESLRYVMRHRLIDGYVVGLKSPEEVDEFCDNFELLSNDINAQKQQV